MSVNSSDKQGASKEYLSQKEVVIDQKSMETGETNPNSRNMQS